MINDSPPKKYLRQGFSPLHYCVIDIFDSLYHDRHQCSTDNLYNSSSFYVNHTITKTRYYVIVFKEKKSKDFLKV